MAYQDPFQQITQPWRRKSGNRRVRNSPQARGEARTNPNLRLQGARGPQHSRAWLAANEKAHDKRSHDIQKLNEAMLRNAKRGQMGAEAAGDPAALDGSGGGGSSGGGGGGGGFAGPDAGAINADYNNQVGQVNQVSAETAARLKAIQDQYTANAQATAAGIQRDTSQLQQQFGGQTQALNTDLAAQGIAPEASPVGGEAVVQNQALRDAQLRGQTFVNQLQMAQGANFADRQQSQAITQQGMLQQLQAQRAGALAGGGSGGGGGGGGGGFGGGGSGADYKDNINYDRQVREGITAANMNAPHYTGMNMLRGAIAEASRGNHPVMLAALRRLQAHPGRGEAISSTLGKHSKNTRAFIKAFNDRRKQVRKPHYGQALRNAQAIQQHVHGG